MPDPLSISTGVLALLQITITVANELKKLHDGASVVRQTISELANNVDSLKVVLESMRDTFESITALDGSGHIATLWNNVARSIEDSKGVLGQLESLVQDINRETSFLDEYRKQLRLNRAEARIAGFRVHVQSYRDGLQLSLQAIILWNQTSYQRTADQVLPNLSDLHHDVRRIASDLNGRIDILQAMVGSQQDETQVVAMSNLRECVWAAASTISSATTIIISALEDDDDRMALASDFGDCFPPQHNLAMRRWIDSRTVYEYDDMAEQAQPPQSVANVAVNDDIDEGPDSDAELESEMTRVLLENGKQKLFTADTKGAEKMLRRCLIRLTTVEPTRRNQQIPVHLEVLDYLYRICAEQQRWDAAQEMLFQRMAVRERLTGKPDSAFLSDVLSLARLMMNQKDTTGAQLHARRALKGFKKLQRNEETRNCLVLLIELCESDGNDNDAVAYAVMLEELYDNEAAAYGAMLDKVNDSDRERNNDNLPGNRLDEEEDSTAQGSSKASPPIRGERPSATGLRDITSSVGAGVAPTSEPTSSETSNSTMILKTNPQAVQTSKGLSESNVPEKLRDEPSRTVNSANANGNQVALGEHSSGTNTLDIRTQMSQLPTAQSTIDDQRRQEDRARLMAAAEKRVRARMAALDEKVFQETGQVSQSVMDEWENSARERAERDRAERAQHAGKTHIGGGKYIDQAEIDAIAAARLKPTLERDTRPQETERAIATGRGKSIVNLKDPGKVILCSFGLEVTGREDIIIDFTKPGALEDLDKHPFTIKEGATFRMKVRFRVQHKAFRRLKYVQVVSRMGVKNKTQEMIGSYAPNTKEKPEYERKFDTETAPSGILGRGHYEAVSKFIDDDNQTHLQLKWSFDIKKDW